MRSLVRAATLAGAVVAISIATAPFAFAHATYKSSNPPDEGRVSSPPSEITAEFTEPMTGGSYMDVTDPCGRDVGTGSQQTGSSMRVQSSGDAAGTYSVYWKAVSIDGHTTVGEFTFTSTGGDPCPGEAEPKDPSKPDSGGGDDEGGSDDPRTTDEGTAVAAADSGDTRGGNDRSKKHGKHSGRKHREKERTGGEDAPGPVAAGPQTDVPDAPSAIEGIPLDGLLITLAVSALIGAAGGKIYVSLSADDS